MEFRLVYDGILPASGNANPRTADKHRIRRVFHQQLKALWNSHPYLRDGFPVQEVPEGAFGPGTKFYSPQGSIANFLAQKYAQFGYRFVPLVRRELALLCNLEILFLRRQKPGNLIHDGDLDNRLKTLFDALRMPQSLPEVAGTQPEAGEDPFFALLHDDALISGMSVVTDELLAEVDPPQGTCRLVIRVDVRPYLQTSANNGFA